MYTTIAYYWDSAPNLEPLKSHWEINKFENCSYKSVRILEVLKLMFHQFLNVSSSQRDMSGPRLEALSKNRWSGGIVVALLGRRGEKFAFSHSTRRWCVLSANKGLGGEDSVGCWTSVLMYYSSQVHRRTSSAEVSSCSRNVTRIQNKSLLCTPRSPIIGQWP